MELEPKRRTENKQAAIVACNNSGTSAKRKGDTRPRIVVRFALELKNDLEVGIADWMEDQKSRKQFKPTMIDAIVLVESLRQGSLEELYRQFPELINQMRNEAYEQGYQDGIGRHDETYQQGYADGVANGFKDMADQIVERIRDMPDRPQPLGPKPLTSGRAIEAPAFDDDDDDEGLIQVTQSAVTTHAAHNLIQAAMNLYGD